MNVLPSNAAPMQSNSVGETAAGDSSDGSSFTDFLTLFGAVATRVTTTSDEVETVAGIGPEPQAVEHDQQTPDGKELAIEACVISLLVPPAFLSIDQSASPTPIETGPNPAATIPSVARNAIETVDVDLMNSAKLPETGGPLSASISSPPTASGSVLDYDSVTIGAKTNPNGRLNNSQDVPSPHFDQVNPSAQIDQASGSTEAVRSTDIKGIGPRAENDLSTAAETGSIVSPAGNGAQDVSNIGYTVTAPLHRVPRAGASEGESTVNPNRRSESPSSSIDGEGAIIEPQANHDHWVSERQSNLAKQPGGSFREPSDWKVGEDKLDQLEPTSSRFPHVPTDAVITATLRHETDAKENATGWRPVVDRVAQEIKTYIQLNKREAVIQLEPPELGRIKIDLRVDGDQLQALITTESGHTKALIENHLSELRQALETGQVGLRNIQVDQQSTPSTGGHSAQGFADTPQQGQGQGQRHGHGESGMVNQLLHDPTPAEISAQTQVDQGRISMWA